MNEEEIFHQALGRTVPEERAAYLDQACAGNVALRAAVEALLRANVGASGFLGSKTCDALLARGDEVVGLRRSPDRARGRSGCRADAAREPERCAVGGRRASGPDAPRHRRGSVAARSGSITG